MMQLETGLGAGTSHWLMLAFMLVRGLTGIRSPQCVRFLSRDVLTVTGLLGAMCLDPTADLATFVGMVVR